LYLLRGSGELEQFPTIVDDQLKALITGRFQLNGKVEGWHVQIDDLAIPEMHVELPEVRSKNLQALDRPRGVELVRNGEPVYRKQGAAKQASEAKAAAEALADTTDGNAAREDALRFTLIVHAPKNIWVKGTDLNTELRFSYGFKIVVAEQTRMEGEIWFLQGRVDVLGRRFDVLKDSQIAFNGTPGAPIINIVAQHTNEREQISVFTTIRGRGSDISIKVNSKPALSESEIYTLLATGGRTLKRGTGASMGGAEAATVATAYMASQLKRVIGTKIPLDLSFEVGEHGLADASGQAGMYLTDDLYVGYQLRPGADESRNENKHSFRLEYQLSPRWSLETEYGDALSGGADLIWSKDY
ncbi:MAG: translocation/assembly module TamB domain-containing protein, partial [Myxococcaceae bacterium]